MSESWYPVGASGVDYGYNYSQETAPSYTTYSEPVSFLTFLTHLPPTNVQFCTCICKCITLSQFCLLPQRQSPSRSAWPRIWGPSQNTIFGSPLLSILYMIFNRYLGNLKKVILHYFRVRLRQSLGRALRLGQARGLAARLGQTRGPGAVATWLIISMSYIQIHVQN